MDTIKIGKNKVNSSYYKNCNDLWDFVLFKGDYMSSVYCAFEKDKNRDAIEWSSVSRLTLDSFSDHRIGLEPRSVRQSNVRIFKIKTLGNESLPEDNVNFYGGIHSYNKCFPVRTVESSFLEELHFIYSLKEIESRNELEALDDLYKYIDNLIDTNALFKIEQIINIIILKEFKLRILIGLLTITHPKKKSLHNRVKLLEHTRKTALNKGLTAKQISSILNGF